MSAKVRLVAFAGSTRVQSYNKKLVRIAARWRSPPAPK